MSNSIKTWMMTAIMAICCLTASAQAKQRLSREQLAERQARHIAQKLALDDKTTKLFTDTYCQYQKEVWALEPKKEKKPETNAAESGEENRSDKSRHNLPTVRRFSIFDRSTMASTALS